MINIRIARPSEFDDAKELIKSIFPDAIVQINDEDTVLVAEDQGKIVGFAHMVDGGERIIVKGLGVAKSLRGYGVGTLLLECLFELIKDDARPVYLKVKYLNPAIDLYGRYGFFLRKFGQTYVLVKKSNS
jgi:GNAT superfamily N-acetyltransferase